MRWTGLAAAAIAISLCSCSILNSKGTPVDRYVLVVRPQADEATQVPLTLGIRPLYSARPYHVDMVYLDEGGKLSDYTGAQWAELPETVVTRALTDAFNATKRFKDVGNAADMARPDIILTGEVREFVEDRTVVPAEAVVEIYAASRYARDTALVWSGVSTARVPLDGSGAEALRKAMQEAVAQAVQEITQNTVASVKD
ncbi:MAG: hypothetical protein GC168_04420 [Candidatus Hydrogenedens sp.]|nr:hypothetical protein [Candidatus Hydrogenedens sp.]